MAEEAVKCGNCGSREVVSGTNLCAGCHELIGQALPLAGTALNPGGIEEKIALIAAV